MAQQVHEVYFILDAAGVGEFKPSEVIYPEPLKFPVPGFITQISFSICSTARTIKKAVQMYRYLDIAARADGALFAEGPILAFSTGIGALQPPPILREPVRLESLLRVECHAQGALARILKNAPPIRCLISVSENPS